VFRYTPLESAKSPPNSPVSLPAPPHALTADAVAQQLRVDPALGLSETDVLLRRKTFGRNLLKKRKQVSELRLLVRQFTSPVVALLAGAMALSLAFANWTQATAIGVVLVINTAIGFVTERKAVRSMEALRALGGRTARVRRDGRAQVVNAEDLVPGDLVLLEAGDIVSADLRCVSTAALAADESTLTGESIPVGKGTEPNPDSAELHERTAMLFKGTQIVRGSGEGIVVGTGLATELGHITQLVDSAEGGESPLEGQLARLSHQLIRVTLLLAVAVALAGLLSGRSVPLMIETAIALAVAAIPEGLPIVATIVLARGMLRMARQNALVENLAAVETLGSTTMVLTDKTGTLTENRMVVQRVVTPTGSFSFDYGNGAILAEGGAHVDPASHADLSQALLIGVLCGNAEYDATTGAGSGDPMEVALVRAGALAGMRRGDELNRSPEVAQYPFDPATKWMATVHRRGGQYFTAVKGAPEEVLALAHRVGVAGKALDDLSRTTWLGVAESLAAEGLRMLAVAAGPCPDPGQAIGSELALIGLVALWDPPRADIADTVAALRRAGIEVVMATGDHPGTALTIARDVGIAGPNATPVTGQQLPGLGVMSYPAGTELARQHVFARVTPEHKLILIDLFQSQNQIVAMIGDGVNDAPALIKADIGVAMGKRGTDVARAAADMVLLDDRFSTIVNAVREGRVIFDNIRRFSMYLLSCNLAEILVVTLAIVAGLPLPLLPLQILFLNLVTDVFPSFALATGEGDGDVLDRPPRRPREPIITASRWRTMAVYGAAIAASTLLALVAAEHLLGLDAGAATTVSFLTIALAQLWHVFNMRSGRSGVVRNAVTANRLVWYSLALCVVLIVAAVTVPVLATPLQIVPIGIQGWGLAMACSLLPLAGGQLWLVSGSRSVRY
jgi:Ca2+-transporting ATPase